MGKKTIFGLLNTYRVCLQSHIEQNDTTSMTVRLSMTLRNEI